MDLPEANERWPQINEELKKHGIEAFAISAVAQQNTRQLVQQIFQVISTLPDETWAETVTETPLYELEDDGLKFEITREDDGVFRVSGYRVERAAAMTYWDYEEAVLRFQDILETLGISKALEEAGIKPGDSVYINTYELEWSD